MASPLNPQQAQFINSLAASMGWGGNAQMRNALGSWVLNEESGGAAASRAAQGNNNWLNIGYFDSGPASWARTAFRNPNQAAALTAKFLKGQWGGASSSIRNIAGATNAQDLMNRIASSDWASSHYGGGRDLQSVYQTLSGGSGVPAMPTTQAAASIPGAGGGAAATSSPGMNLLGYLMQQNADFASGHSSDPLKQSANMVSMLEGRSAIQSGPTSRMIAPGVATDHAGPISPNAPAIVQLAKKYLGTPYVWGGADPKTGFDCSGFVQWLYKQQGINLPRTTYEQINVGQHINNMNQLQPGDIVFFNTEGNGPSHEGMYIGNNQFIQSPHTGDHIKISSLSDPYYAQRFLGGRRVA